MKAPKTLPKIICDDEGCMKLMEIGWVDRGRLRSDDYIIAACHDVEYLLLPTLVYNDGLYNSNGDEPKLAAPKLIKSVIEGNYGWLKAEDLFLAEGTALDAIIQQLDSLTLYNRVRRSQGLDAPRVIAEDRFKAILDALALFAPSQLKAE